MPELNANVPRFPVYVRNTFLHGMDEDRRGLTPGICHAVCALPARALGFHVLLENGAHIGRLPIHALAHRAADHRTRHPWELQLWDCFSAQVAVIEYDWLCECRCRVYLPDGKAYGGEYLFTVDYWNSPTADDAGETGWKCHHLIALDDGRLAAQPNNRVCFFEPSSVTPFPVEEVPPYKTMPRTWKCEDGSKWRCADEGKMFYGVETIL